MWFKIHMENDDGYDWWEPAYVATDNPQDAAQMYKDHFEKWGVKRKIISAELINPLNLTSGVACR